MTAVARSDRSAVDVSSWGHQYHHEVAAYLDAIDQAALADAINIPWAEYVTGGDVFNHLMVFSESVSDIPAVL